MEFRDTGLKGCILVVPRVFQDPRGFFFESYHAEKHKAGGIEAVFVQDNHSRSKQGTLRGLHAQWRKPQGKLVRCVQGEVFDVAVDARQGSPTLGKSIGVVLSAENKHQLYVPEGFLHGFCVTSEWAEVEYKCTDFYDPGGEVTVAWNDPALRIEWPALSSQGADAAGGAYVLSEKDARGIPFQEAVEQLARGA